MLNKATNKAYKLLKWSEKYTKTDMVYLTKGGGWLSVSKFITIGAAFLTSVVFANLLLAADYGLYRYVLSFVSIFSIATLPGVDTALIRAIGQGKSNGFLSELKTKIKWGTLGSLVSLCFSIYYFANGNIPLSIGFLIMTVFTPFMEPFYIYMSYLNGTKQYDSYTKYNVIIKIVVVATLVTTIFFTQNVIIILFIYLFIHTFMRGVFVLVTAKNIPPSSKHLQNSQNTEEIIAFGKHLTFMKVLGIVSTTIDKILVFHYIGAVALAGYYLALVPFKQVQGVFGSLNILALPQFSKNDDSALLRKTLPKKVLRLYLLVIPTIIVYAIFAQFAFELVYPKYTDFAWISIVFMLSLLFFPLTLFHTALTASGKTKTLYMISTTTAIARITLLVTLIPMFGLTGAVASVLISNMINSLVISYYFFRSTRQLV